MNAMHPTREIYDELQTAYDYFNVELFGGELPPCLITLQREKRTYGYFCRERFVNRGGATSDEIAMNPSYFGVRSIKHTLSTLVHEMVHQWQYRHGKPGRRGYHNREWADRMESLGLIPSHTGQEGGKRVGERMSHYIAPGGAFDVACDALLTRDFVLSWLDRFPPTIPTGEATGRALANPTGGESGGTVEAAPTSAGSDVSPYVQAPPLEPVNRSNRVKYRCPMCGAQVWGKRGLGLICGGEGCEQARFDVVG